MRLKIKKRGVKGLSLSPLISNKMRTEFNINIDNELIEIKQFKPSLLGQVFLTSKMLEELYEKYGEAHREKKNMRFQNE